MRRKFLQPMNPPASDSDPAPVFGAVFGLTENIDCAPDSVTPPRRKAKAVESAPPAGFRPSLSDKTGTPARKRCRERRQRGLPKELLVTEVHLKSFDALHDLLRSFQDPFAAGSELKKHVEEIPVLSGRLLRTARITTGQMDLKDIGLALSLLGNKVLEQELLQLLEDLTEVKADWQEKQNPPPRR